MPGRAIRNEFIEKSEAGERPSFRCAWKCLSSCKAGDARYCISIALNNARRGRLGQGFVFAGSNAWRVTEVVPVSSLISELSEEYQRQADVSVMRRLETLVSGIQDLRSRYDGARRKVRELGLAYERSLAARIQEARDSGVEQIRRQYEQMLDRLRTLQFQIMESLADSWALLRRPG